jgi:hypothetical protein
MRGLLENTVSIASLAAGLWALEHVDDLAARLVVFYTTFCAFVAPMLLMRALLDR